MMLLQPLLEGVRRSHPYPVLFATLSGSRAFGYASASSDYDIHGVHLIPVAEVLGLGTQRETIKEQHLEGDCEVESATHDLRKFVFLLLKSNGNVLEDLYSPHVVCTGPVHEELKLLGRGCITKKSANHYRGMANNQQRGLQANELKKLLHMYRCLLMGFHLMRTGEIELHLPHLADLYQLPALHDLITCKVQGLPEPAPDVPWHLAQIVMLHSQLELAQDESSLPEYPSTETRTALEQLVIYVRLTPRHWDTPFAR